MSAVAVFDMERDGRAVVYSYRGSWVAEGRSTTWEASWRIVGSRGTVTYDGSDRIDAEVVADESSKAFQRPMRVVDVPAVPPLEHEGHAALLRDFLSAVESGGRRRPMCAAADNLPSLAMVLAAAESARRRERVQISW